MDKNVNGIVGQDKALVFIGSTQFSPNSPIRGYVRCPGLKRFVTYFKKKRNCVIILVDEYNTSQVCGKCFKAFDKRLHKNRPGRQRICFNCNPGVEMTTANVVLTKKNIRKVKTERKANVQSNDHVSKWTRVVPKNQLDQDVSMNNKNTLWDRDVSAARVILYKGESYT